MALSPWILLIVGKLALQLHPDKNGAPGADEAFKSEELRFLL